MKQPDKFNGTYRKTSTRVPWHDYNEGVFFITICTHNHTNFFGNISPTDNTIALSPIGIYTQQCIVKIEELHQHVSVPISQVMPNHVHLIIRLKQPLAGSNIRSCDRATIPISLRDSSTRNEGMRHIASLNSRLSRIVTAFKGAVTKYARNNNMPFEWQSNYHDHIIRDNDQYTLIFNYIQNNITTWIYDRFYNK